MPFTDWKKPWFCDLTVLAAGRITREWFVGWERALRRLEVMDKLVVAAVHGYCIGGGLQVALACDVRVARDDTILGLPAVKECLVPGLGVWRLPRYVGLGRAKRMILTGETIGAADALAIGLVDYVAPTDRFDAEVARVADALAGVAFASAIEAKRLIDRAFEPYAPVLAAYLDGQGRAMASQEHAGRDGRMAVSQGPIVAISDRSSRLIHAGLRAAQVRIGNAQVAPNLWASVAANRVSSVSGPPC